MTQSTRWKNQRSNLGLEEERQRTFLRDKRGKDTLFCIEQSKQVDLKKVPALVESSNLSCSSPERLMKHLGILPGSVSLLALINDSDGQVEVLVRSDLGRGFILTIIHWSYFDPLAKEGSRTYINKTGRISIGSGALPAT